MNTNDILIIISKSINVDVKLISIDSKSSDFEKWDSLGHLSILIGIDNTLKGRASDIAELASADSVAKIIDILRLHALIKDD